MQGPEATFSCECGSPVWSRIVKYIVQVKVVWLKAFFNLPGAGASLHSSYELNLSLLHYTWRVLGKILGHFRRLTFCCLNVQPHLFDFVVGLSGVSAASNNGWSCEAAMMVEICIRSIKKFSHENKIVHNSVDHQCHESVGYPLIAAVVWSEFSLWLIQ